MVKSVEEIMEEIRRRIGDDTSDEALAFVENVSDTLSDLDAKAKDTTDWEAKYTENDTAWREKYRARFFEAGTESAPEVTDPEPEEPVKKLTFDELFKEG